MAVIWLQIFCRCEGSCCYYRTVNFEYTSWRLIWICAATNFWWRRCRLIQKSRRDASVYCMAPDARCCGDGRLVLGIVCARRSKLKFGGGWEHNFPCHGKSCIKILCLLPVAALYDVRRILAYSSNCTLIQSGSASLSVLFVFLFLWYPLHMKVTTQKR